MTKKYWTSNKSTVEKERLNEEKLKSKAETEDSTSCGDSVQEIIEVKANNMKNAINRDGKKPYDLWVNDNIDRSENVSSGDKKLDLPGRVSFRYGCCCLEKQFSFWKLCFVKVLRSLISRLRERPFTPWILGSFDQNFNSKIFAK